MGRWVIALLAAGVALAAASARAEVVLSPTVYASHKLPSNAITSFTVTCPPGYAAVSAGVSTPAPGTTLLGTTPAGLRAYTFRFGNPATNGARRVTVAAACRKVRAGRPVLKVKPVKLRLRIKPGTVKTATLPCPSQTTPAGSGVDLAPAGPKSARAFAGGSPLSLRASTASLRGFSFAIRNAGRRARDAVAYGTCLTVVRAAGTAAEPLRVEITTFTDPVNPGLQRIGHACRAGWFSLGAGYTTSSRAVTVPAAAAIDGRGKWSVANRSDSATTVGVQLVCGRLGG